MSEDSDLKQRILNAIGHENATGTILWELDEIRKAIGVPTVRAKVVEERIEREEVTHLVRLLASADSRIDDLIEEIREKDTEIQFHASRSDEWERMYREHMENCRARS